MQRKRKKDEVDGEKGKKLNVLMLVPCGRSTRKGQTKKSMEGVQHKPTIPRRGDD